MIGYGNSFSKSCFIRGETESPKVVWTASANKPEICFILRPKLLSSLEGGRWNCWSDFMSTLEILRFTGWATHSRVEARTRLSAISDYNVSFTDPSNTNTSSQGHLQVFTKLYGTSESVVPKLSLLIAIWYNTFYPHCGLLETKWNCHWHIYLWSPWSQLFFLCPKLNLQEK